MVKNCSKWASRKYLMRVDFCVGVQKRKQENTTEIFLISMGKTIGSLMESREGDRISCKEMAATNKVPVMFLFHRNEYGLINRSV